MSDAFVRAVRKEQNVRIPMRDGVELAADFYYPDAAGPFPTIVERTPYNRQESVLLRTGTPEYLASRGYLVVIQDVRGRYGSDGNWFPFVHDGWGTLRDGYDTVEWLARQPLSNGQVGTIGGSFAGQTQLLLAVARPPHLKCAYVREAASDLASQWLYRGGAFELAFNIDWNLRHTLPNIYQQFGRVKDALDRKPAIFAEGPWLLHPMVSDPFAWLRETLARADDPSLFEPLNLESKYDQVAIPIKHLGGWFDIFLDGTLRNFDGIRSSGSNRKARDAQRLIVGPWIHGPSVNDPEFARHVGDMDFGPGAVFDLNYDMLLWFDYWLKQERNRVAQTPAVEYFLMQANEWRSCTNWPPEGAERRLFYLDRGRNQGVNSLNGGSLVTRKPAGKSGADSFRYDPADPVPTLGGSTLYSVSYKRDASGIKVPDHAEMAGPRDQRGVLPRCLTYTSHPLSAPLDVVGPVQVVLYASSSTADTDFVARLCDLFPDGRSILVADGILRARYRNHRFRPTPLKPGKAYKLVVDLWSTAWQFQPGHSIQVVVTSSCFPRFDCNPNTGQNPAANSDSCVATNRIFRTAKLASHLVLTVLASS